MNRQNSGDQVAEHIRGLIFRGELTQGEHIRQDEIAADLGVSRIPVREALIALDREGWITLEPHRGAFVHGMDDDAVTDHYELVGVLLAMTARRAARRADDAGLARLGQARRLLAESESDDAFLRDNELYMRQLFALAAAPRLRSASRLMSHIVPGNFFAEVPGAREIQRRGLTAATRAVTARDGELAAAKLGAMMQAQGKAVVKLMRARRRAASTHVS